MPSEQSPLQRALLSVLPTDPKDALPMRRIIPRLQGFLGPEAKLDERNVRGLAQSLARAGAVGILTGTPETPFYRYWRRAA